MVTYSKSVSVWDFENLSINLDINLKSSMTLLALSYKIYVSLLRQDTTRKRQVFKNTTKILYKRILSTNAIYKNACKYILAWRFQAVPHDFHLNFIICKFSYQLWPIFHYNLVSAKLIVFLEDIWTSAMI